MRYDTYRFLDLTPDPDNKNVFLLGQSKDGPINKPLPITSIDQAIKIFGPESEGNLVQSYRESSFYEDINIFLVRVTGNYAKGNLQGSIDNEETDVIQIRSMFGGEDYNQVYTYIEEIEGKPTLIIEMPSRAIGRGYVLEEYNNIQHLIHTVNHDTDKYRNVVYMTTSYPDAPIDCLFEFNQEEKHLSQGEDGLDLTKNELYLALDTTYSLLEGLKIDSICPVSARFDDTHPSYYYNESNYGLSVFHDRTDTLSLVDTENNNRPVTFHEQLIEFCRKQERAAIVTHGVIGVHELTSDEVENRQTNYHLRLVRQTAFNDRDGLLDFEKGTWYDKGHYITVFVGDLLFHAGSNQSYVKNGAALYSTLLASIEPYETTTNKKLPDNVELLYEFEEEELNEFTYIGVTSVRHSVKKGPVIANGVTASMYNSSLHSISNVLTVQHTLNRVNLVLDDMIGEPFVPATTEREIYRRLDNELEELIQSRVLQDYFIDIEIEEDQMSAIIKIDLLAQYAVEHISTSANLSFVGGGGAT